jgi:4a-hydroxytetrahydrobiopterin dehydratase
LTERITPQQSHRMVRDEFAPSWWTLADAEGNDADIATTMGRD